MFKKLAASVLERCPWIPVSAKTRWDLNIDSEIRYWDRLFRKRGAEFDKRFGGKLDPEMPLQPGPLALLPDAAEVRILDVCAGPLTVLGKKAPGKVVRMTAVDPLADAYGAILDRNGLVPPVRTEKAAAEELSRLFPENTFDLVFARNCIDHSYHPETAVLEMLKVVKKGCYVLMEHQANEAVNQGYHGLHQWNLSCDAALDFIISSKDASVNFTQKYRALCETTCVLRAKDDWLTTKIRKL